jgi:hypothetical protein
MELRRRALNFNGAWHCTPLLSTSKAPLPERKARVRSPPSSPPSAEQLAEGAAAAMASAEEEPAAGSVARSASGGSVADGSQAGSQRVILPPLERGVSFEDAAEEAAAQEEKERKASQDAPTDDAQRQSAIRRAVRDDLSASLASNLSSKSTIDFDFSSEDEEEEASDEEGGVEAERGRGGEPDVDLKFNIRSALNEHSRINQGYAWALGYLAYIVFNCALLMLQSDVPRSFEVYRTLQNALKFGSGSMQGLPADLKDVPAWLKDDVLSATFADPVCGDGRCTAPYEFAAFAEAGCLADCGLEVGLMREGGF